MSVPSSEAAPLPDEGPVDPTLLPDNAEIVAGGALRVAGVDLIELAETHGTPLFVYDEEHLRTRCREARRAWDEGVAYTTKAFLCLAMARLASDEELFLDVSTGGELHVALAAGVAPRKIVLHGNNKNAAELTSAIRCGVGRIVVDSFDELDRLGALLEGAGASRIGVARTGHPGSRGAHPRIRPDRPAGLEVRIRPRIRGCSVCRGASS